MLIDSDFLASSLFNDVFLKDSYGLNHFIRDNTPNVIVDIGANVGFFSIRARSLFPEARIIAIEPNKDTFKKLIKNTQHLNIEAYPYALGDGRTVELRMSKIPENSNSGSVWAKPSKSGTIKTKRLSEVFDEFCISIDDKYMIKIDCEGGEHSIPEHKDSEKVLFNAFHWSMELHLDPNLWPHCNYDKLFFQNWVLKNIKNEEKLHCSFRNELGLMTYRGL